MCDNCRWLLKVGIAIVKILPYILVLHLLRHREENHSSRLKGAAFGFRLCISVPLLFRCSLAIQIRYSYLIYTSPLQWATLSLPRSESDSALESYTRLFIRRSQNRLDIKWKLSVNFKVAETVFQKVHIISYAGETDRESTSMGNRYPSEGFSQKNLSTIIIFYYKVEFEVHIKSLTSDLKSELC